MVEVLVFSNQDIMAKKIREIIAKTKAGEKILPPKSFLKLIYRCPMCGRKVKKQKYLEFATAFASVGIYHYFECRCGWRYAKLAKIE